MWPCGDFTRFSIATWPALPNAMQQSACLSSDTPIGHEVLYTNYRISQQFCAQFTASRNKFVQPSA
jgi:hypothetical protein